MRVYYCDEDDWFCDEQDRREKLWKEANDKLKETIRQITLEREQKNKISKEIEKQEIIDGILDEFDFDTVERVMHMVGWVYGAGETEHIPSKTEMRKLARELLNYTLDNQITYFCGGYKASSWKEDNGHLRAKLEFILSETSSYLE